MHASSGRIDRSKYADLIAKRGHIDRGKLSDASRLVWAILVAEWRADILEALWDQAKKRGGPRLYNRRR